MSKKRKTVDPTPKQSNSTAEVFNGGKAWLFRALVGRASWREENISARRFKTKDLAVSAAFAAGYSKVKCDGVTMTRSKLALDIETPASICKDETEAVAHLDDEELQELHRIRTMLHSDALRQKIVDEMIRRKLLTPENTEAPKEETHAK